MASALPTTAVEGQQQNQYDVQRKQIQEQERRSREAQNQALQRRLAGSGFTRGSGMLEAQEARQEQAGKEQEAARLGQVDVAQLAAQQATQEAEAGRTLTREQMAQQAEQFGQTQEQAQAQFEATQAQQAEQFGQTIGLEIKKLDTTASLTREQMMQDLGLSEAELRQREKEFYGGQTLTREQMIHEYNLEVTRQAMTTAIETARNSVAYKEIASREGIAAAERSAQLNIVTKQIAEQKAAREAQLGYEYEALYEQVQQAAGRLALEGGRLALDEATAKRAADLAVNQFAWEKQQRDEDQAWAQKTYEGDQKFQKDMALLNDKIATGQITLQDAIDDANSAVKVKLDSLFERGANGEVIDTSRMNPTELAAYNMGLAGNTKDQMDRDIQGQLDLRNSMVINASEPEVVDRIAHIYATFGVY